MKRTGIAIAALTLLVLGGTAALRWESIAFRWNRWRAESKPLQLTLESAVARGTPNSKTIEAAKAFQDFLAERQIELSVVIQPTAESLYETLPDQGSLGVLRESAIDLSLDAEATAEAMRRDGIAAEYALAEIERLHYFNEGKGVFLDGLHYLHGGYDSIARVAARLGNEHPQSMLIVGDCHAADVAHAFARIGLPKPRAVSRNCGSPRMPFEVSQLPPEVLTGVRRVVWSLMDSDVSRISERQFMKPTERIPAAESGEKAVIATIAKATPIDPELPTKAPYHTAVVAHQFTSAPDGETFIGLTYVMKDRAFTGGEEFWKNGDQLFVTISPWTRACELDPELKGEMIIETLDDYDSPRFWIQSWVAISH